MSLSYYPRPGEIVLCHFAETAIVPEMVKVRPVVVVGPRLRQRGSLATIVPLSTTAPKPVQAFHAELLLAEPLPPPFDKPVVWAKADMVQSVALARLDRFKERRRGQPRTFRTGMLVPEQLTIVRRALLAGLGFDLDKLANLAK